jgi:glycosyltransferase involved in cell wall biosynthesis
VEWLGWQCDMPSILAQSHIICLPSYYGEGVPRVLIEAAACGRSIIAADTPGCREVVRHGENGFLVPPRDPETLAGALNVLIENPRLRAKMGLRGREIAVCEFSLGQVLDANLDTYQSLLIALQMARPNLLPLML